MTSRRNRQLSGSRLLATGPQKRVSRERVDTAVYEAVEAWLGRPGVPAEWRFRSPVSSPRGRTARMGALEEFWGGPREAAAAVGVTPRTWRSWRAAGARPVRASLEQLDGAYEALLGQRADTPKRRRALAAARLAAAAGEAIMASIKVFVELQVDGYYNGQDTNSPKDRPYPPDPDNGHAYRGTNGASLGRQDISGLLRAYVARRGGQRALNAAAAAQISDQTFCNAFWPDNHPRVELS